MNTLEQAVKLALEALEDINQMQDYYGNGFDLGEEITALREALAQPQGEPVAWRSWNHIYERWDVTTNPTILPDGEPLYVR